MLVLAPLSSIVSVFAQDDTRVSVVLRNDASVDRTTYSELQVAARRLAALNGVRTAVFELAPPADECQCHDTKVFACVRGVCSASLQGGDCVEARDGSVKCTCLPGFSGEFCKTIGDEHDDSHLGDRLSQWVYQDLSANEASELVQSHVRLGAPFVSNLKVSASTDPATGLTVVRVYGKKNMLSDGDIAELSKAWTLIYKDNRKGKLVTHSLGIGKLNISAKDGTPGAASTLTTTSMSMLLAMFLLMI